MMTRTMTLRSKRNTIKKEYNEEKLIKDHITLAKNSKIIKKVRKNKNAINFNRKLDVDVKIFCKVFTKIIDKITSEFIHSNDSSNDIWTNGYEKVFEYERGFKIIYKPEDEKSRGGAWVEWADIDLVVPDDINISEEQEKEIYKEINFIYSLLIRDFNAILKKSENTWYDKLIYKDYDQDASEVNWIPDQNKILRITTPFRRISPNVFSLRYNLCEECFYYWNPLSVLKYGKDLKMKKVKKEYQTYSGDLDEEYKDKDDKYEYIEDKIPKSYMDKDHFEDMVDDGYNCEYAVLTE